MPAGSGRQLPGPHEWPSLPGQAEDATEPPPGWEPDQAPLQSASGWDAPPAQQQAPQQPQNQNHQQRLNVGAQSFEPPGGQGELSYMPSDGMGAAAAYAPYMQQPPLQVLTCQAPLNAANVLQGSGCS